MPTFISSSFLSALEKNGALTARAGAVPFQEADDLRRAGKGVRDGAPLSNHFEQTGKNEINPGHGRPPFRDRAAPAGSISVGEVVLARPNRMSASVFNALNAVHR